MNRHVHVWFYCFIATMVPAAEKEADVIFRGGRIITVDPDRPQADAVAVRSNRIIAVLDQDEIEQWTGDGTRVIELSDSQTLLPGLIESHAHLVQMGEALMTIDLSRKSSWEEIIDAVATAVKGAPDGTWIVGTGWHQSKWDQLPADAVDGYPSHERLSAISPNHPVTLSHASYHGSFANALAMKLAGIDASTPDPPGGTILRNDRGEATGAMLETAAGLISRAKAKSDANVAAEIRRQRYALAVQLATEECLRNGVTTFSDAGLSVGEINELISLSETVGLGIRVHVMIRDSNDRLAANLARLRRVDDANGFLTIRGIKKMIDGALGSHGAWLLSPYDDRPASRGLSIAPADEIRRAAELAIEHRYQLCVHAIGDRANRETLNHFETESARANVDLSKLRWRIEHAQHLDPEDIPRFGRLGVIASVQGVHCTSDSVFVPARLGYRRAGQGAFAWRALLDSGAVLCNGTDAPVESINPFASLQSSVTRAVGEQMPFFPEQSMTREEALRSYTADAAFALFAEGSRGSIEVGKLADLVIIDRDWQEMRDDEIERTTVFMTMVDGKIAYANDAFVRE